MNQIVKLTTLLAISLLGCNQSTNQTEPEVAVETNSNTARYLALGDSYTIGESVSESDRYPIQLSDRLREDGVELDTTIIIAKTGWRTDDLMSAIESTNPEGTFDIVSLLIGVNNQYQGRPIAQYESEFATLIATAIKFAGGDKSKVFVISIPDYGYTPFGKSNQATTSSELDEYNAINERITKDQGISWYNITPISRNGLTDTALVASDGLHPSGVMYRQWVDLFYEEVKEKLE